MQNVIIKLSMLGLAGVGRLFFSQVHAIFLLKPSSNYIYPTTDRELEWLYRSTSHLNDTQGSRVQSFGLLPHLPFHHFVDLLPHEWNRHGIVCHLCKKMEVEKSSPWLSWCLESQNWKRLSQGQSQSNSSKVQSTGGWFAFTVHITHSVSGPCPSSEKLTCWLAPWQTWSLPPPGIQWSVPLGFLYLVL